jgi:hypothetical protein
MRLIRLLIILSCIQFTVTLAAQQYGRIKGRITDENKLPVLGATVTVKELTKGTITDNDGFFEMEIPANQACTIEAVNPRKCCCRPGFVY